MEYDDGWSESTSLKLEKVRLLTWTNFGLFAIIFLNLSFYVVSVGNISICYSKKLKLPISLACFVLLSSKCFYLICLHRVMQNIYFALYYSSQLISLVL